MHFTRMGAYDSDNDVPIIVRGEGRYVYDEHGKRYLDGLSGLFCCNAGHGRAEIGEATARRSRARLRTPTGATRTRGRSSWRPGSLAHAGRPQPRLLHLRRLGGRRVGAEARPRNYYRMTGKGQKHKVIARETAYHGTTMGALMATGLTALRAPFEPFAPGGCHVPNTNSYHWPEDRDPLWAADQIAERIEFEGPETVAAVILEPVQNAGGCIPPQEGYFQRVREICDTYDVLLISDEVICAWGRLGYWFGCERYDYQPDIITVAKALTSAYAPMGR